MSFIHSIGSGVSKRSELFCWIGLAGLITFGAGAARPTSKFEGPQATHEPLLVGAQIPAQLLSSVERACQDCHSDNTAWPWYSGIPPLSWQIHHDVAQARRFMDLSKWNGLHRAREAWPSAINGCRPQDIRHASAPYVWMHPEARLSEAELVSLENWAVDEQQRIRRCDDAQQPSLKPRP